MHGNKIILTGSINLQCVRENQQQREHMEYAHLQAGSPCLEGGNNKLATSRNSAVYEVGLCCSMYSDTFITNKIILSLKVYATRLSYETVLMFV